ncbi:MAG: SelL-related redox protein [Saprospiraceae bacterium]
MPLAETMKLMKTSDGSDVFTISESHLVFLVFLRHFGCVFCRESLVDLSKKMEVFHSQNITPVFVHMTDNQTAEKYFAEYNWKEVIHVSDPETRFYLAFGLVKGRFNQLFGLKTLVRGFEVAATKGIFPTLTTVGDGFQMPGIFLVKNGKILESYIHASAADKPDYDTLIRCCSFS